MPEPSDAPQLILASRSPRRARLLREAGFLFDQADPPFHDPPQPSNHHSVTPAELAAELARQKALSLRAIIQQRLPPKPLAASHLNAVHPRIVILAADTICVGNDGQLIGQPADRDDAKRMIEHFIQNTHAVVTGVALLATDAQEPIVFADEACVTLGLLNSAQLNKYLDSGKWHGKAGAYNLFDRQHAGWPLTVAGDPTTVVGLPMRKLVPLLARMDIHPQSV